MKLLKQKLKNKVAVSINILGMSQENMDILTKFISKEVIFIARGKGYIKNYINVFDRYSSDNSYRWAWDNNPQGIKDQCDWKSLDFNSFIDNYSII